MQDINEFRLNQSAIKDWGKMSPQAWYETWILGTRQRKITPSLTLGSILDALQFSHKDFDKNFIISSAQLPSENVQILVNHVYDHITELNNNITILNEKEKKDVPLKPFLLSDYQSLIELKATEIEYYSKKPIMAYNKVIKEGEDYFIFKQTTAGKKIISQADYDKSAKMKEICYTDPASKPFFVAGKKIELLFQLHIRSEFEIGYDNVEFMPVKGTLDILRFNHNKKTVREIDAKYTANAFKFLDRVKDMDYGTQHSFYDFLIREWLKTYKKGKYKNYTIEPPLNVVIDDVEMKPYIYKYSFDDLEIKRYGMNNTYYINNYQGIVGWEGVIKEISWHMENNDWSRPMQHIKNGSIPVKLFKK